MYNPGIPNANDLLSNSQGQIKTNFTQANNIYGFDHFAFNNVGPNTGKHLKATFPISVLPVSAVGDFVLWATNLVSGGPSQLYYTRDNTADSIPIAGILDPIAGVSGYSFLPGNIMIQWGRQNTSGTSTPVTFPRKFTSIYIIQVTGSNPASAVAASGQSTSGFNIVTSVIPQNCFWLAIGNKTDTL
jgi:hypothetical protein